MSKTIIIYPCFSAFMIYLYINKWFFFSSYLIFGFIFDLLGKMVQLETCWRLEDGGMQNPALTL